MEIRQLQYFVAVVDEGSFSKAARSLHISQPSLSQTIKTLEHELDSQLLERNTRHIQITDGGKLLYQWAKELILSLSIFEKEIEDINKTGNGELHVGIIESTQHWIPSVIKKFKLLFPNMRINFTEVLNRKHVIQLLRQYDIHFAITNQLIKESDILFEPIYQEKFVMIMHENNPLAKNDLITPNDLITEPLIISKEGYQTRTNILEFFSTFNITPNIMFEIERFETAWNLVEENLGIAFVPENYKVYGGSSSVIRKTIDSPLLTRTVYLAHIKNRHFPLAIKKLINEILKFSP